MRGATAVVLLLSVSARAAFWGGDPLTKPRSLFEAGKYSEVIAELSPKSLQKLRRERLAQAYLYLGLSYQGVGRRGEALSTYQLAAKLFPKDLNLLSELAALLHHTELDEQAEPLFKKVLAIHPNNSRAHLGLAEIDRSLGLLDSSAGHYEAALESMSEQAPVWRDYAEVLLAQRDFKTAELAVRKALHLSDDAVSRIDLALIQRAGDKLDEALASLDEALKLDPSRTEITLMRGLWCLEAGRWAQAKQAASFRLKMDADDPLALWIRARVSLREDRYGEAVRDLKAAARGDRRARFTAEAAKTLLLRLEAGSSRQ